MGYVPLFHPPEEVGVTLFHPLGAVDGTLFHPGSRGIPVSFNGMVGNTPVCFQLLAITQNSERFEGTTQVLLSVTEQQDHKYYDELKFGLHNFDLLWHILPLKVHLYYSCLTAPVGGNRLWLKRNV